MWDNLSYHTQGSLNKVFLLLAGTAVFGQDGLSPKQLVWVACNLGGAFLYSWSRLRKGSDVGKKSKSD